MRVRPCPHCKSTWTALKISRRQSPPGKSRFAGSLFRLRNSLAYLRQGRNRRERLTLIPVGDGAEVVAAVVSMTVLDSIANGPLERNRVVGVPSVQAVAAARPFRESKKWRTIIEICEWHACRTSEIPGAAEIILRSRAVDGRFRVVVDEDHFVAFAEPAV